MNSFANQNFIFVALYGQKGLLSKAGDAYKREGLFYVIRTGVRLMTAVTFWF
jgi:hypothetical protein